MKIFGLGAALTALLVFVTACQGGGGATGSPAGTGGESPAETAAGEGEVPETLLVGFVPSREAEQLVEDIQPLVAHLEEALGMPVEGFVSTDYAALVTAMETDQAHLGAFGPFSLLQARDRAGAEIILQSERFGSPTYHTQFFTNNPDKYCDDEPVETEDGFLNCNGTAEAEQGPVAVDKLALVDPSLPFAFGGDESSTSGYQFPALLLIDQGHDLEEVRSNAIFADGHPGAVISVCEAEDGAEVGASFDDARGAAETTCDVAANVVVFAYGPEIPNDGWAVAGDLPDDLKEEIKQVLLDYADTEEGQATLESIYEITGLVEADEESFQIVEDAARELGIEGD